MGLLDVTELPISLEEVVVSTLLTDEDLLNYFASRGRVLEAALFHPMRALDDSDPADILGTNTPKPFALLQMGGETGTTNNPIYATFTLQLYDDSENRYNELRRMAALAQNALDRKFMPSVQGGFTQWFRVDANGVSPPIFDMDYQCDNMFVRFACYGG